MNWTINGRFLTQRTTGVQRFAREMVSALDSHLGRGGRHVGLRITAPDSAEALPNLRHIDLRRSGRFRGYLWEQASLPFEVEDGLVSLCNTGPVAIVRQIVCIHDANVWMFPSSYSRAFRAVNRILLPILGRRATKILTVSQASADALVALGIAPARKIEVIGNGHEHVAKWDSRRSRLFEHSTFPRRPFVFALGSQAAHKNLGLLLRIAPKLDDLGLDLYVSGGSFGIFASETRLTTSSNVRMLGYVSDDDLALLYEQALCLVFPSFVEGFGLPLVEAMAFGCPIISSNTSCMPEICGDYANYAAPDNCEAWVSAVAGVMRDTPARTIPLQRLSQFSWSEASSRLLDLISSVS